MTGKNNLKHVENSGIFYMKNLLNSTYHCTFRSFFGIIEVEKTLVKEGLEMQNIESLRKENEALKTELQASEIRVVGLTKLKSFIFFIVDGNRAIFKDGDAVNGAVF